MAESQRMAGSRLVLVDVVVTRFRVQSQSLAVAAVPAPEQAMSGVLENGLRRGKLVFGQVTPFQQGTGCWGQVGILRPAQRSARKTGKFSTAALFRRSPR